MILDAKVKQIVCNASRIYKREQDGIVVVEVDTEDPFDMVDYYDILDAIKIIGNERKQYIMVNISPRTMPTLEARNYIANPESGIYTLARAIVLKSLAHRILGNFILNVQRPATKTKLCANEEEALRWLHHQQSKEEKNLEG